MKSYVNPFSVEKEGDSSEQIYRKFCNEIFGVFISRPVLKDDEVESNYQMDNSYQKTLIYFNYFEYLINPFWLLWPDYKNESHMRDYHMTSWVSRKQLNEIHQKIDKYLEEGRFFHCNFNILIGKGDWERIASDIIKEQKDKVKIEATKPSELSKDKFVTPFSKNKPMIFKKIYNNFDSCNYGIKTLQKRLQDKYLLSEATAEAWIREFRKFVTIMLTES